MLSDELAELLCRLRQQHWTLIRWGDALESCRIPDGLPVPVVIRPM